ncbi:uncharacterized protein LOC120626486 [Pararge aegeria]|uniref:uncharacterized protein LOC120626486 n=1 Tax=Pararge aegeria TaxID=116150 RepID=UPI0019D004A0|nr:uncharacterized protein LOC120626486 [Pararge aegeria]
MGFLHRLWRRATQCKALEESSGELETLFFESVYRVTYFAGWSILDSSILYHIYSGILKSSVGFLICCETWQLFSDSSNLDGIIDNVNVTLMHFIALYRYKNMRENRAIYKKLASAMESPYFDTSTSRRKALIKFWAARNEKFLKLLLALGSCTLGAWHIYPLVDDIDYNLMVSARFPFDYQTPIRFPIFYAIVLIVFNYASLFVMVNDLIMQAHLMHLLCQYTVLADCFEGIISDCMDENCKCVVKIYNFNHLAYFKSFKDRYLKRLSNLVEQHKIILNNTTDLKHSLSVPMLGQLAASAMLICFVGYQATTTVGRNKVKFFMSLLYLMYNLFELSIFCKWCDEIKLQSENIGQSVYCSGWERGLATTPGVRATLLIVASRARKPLVLAAGGLFDLSLASYTTLVKTSYSAITVLRRLQQKWEQRGEQMTSGESLGAAGGKRPRTGIMEVLGLVWKKLTNTNALELASGQFEIDFFESVYRVIYFAGLSASDRGVPYMIYSSAVKTLQILLVAFELWYLFSVTWTIDGITNCMNVILIQFGAYYRYKIMKINKEIFKNLASSMESQNFDLSTNQRKVILNVWRTRNESSLKLLLFLGSSTLIAWFIYPLMDNLEYNLLLEIRLPFQYQTPSRYPYAYMGNLIALFYISYFVMSTDLIMQSHLMHLLCQFAVLKDCFQNILTDCKLLLKDEDTMDLANDHLNEMFRREYIKRLGNLVDQHVFILNNTLELRDIMSTPMLAQLICSTVLICSIGFQVATSVNVNLTKWLMSVFYLGYNMFVQYVICRWCEEIKIQSEGIGEAVYYSGWENGIVTVPGVSTSILLILARANKPVRLSAGGMYDLSLEAYATVVKTSYSALTVLLRFR